MPDNLDAPQTPPASPVAVEPTAPPAPAEPAPEAPTPPPAEATADSNGSPAAPPAAPAPETLGDSPDAPQPAAPASKKRWYVVKVQSGREETIKEAIERRVKIEGLEDFFGQIVIPTEVVTEMRKSKRVKKEHKLYPGYLMVEVEYNDRILYLFRETSGVGDFVGHTIVNGVQRPPVPMNDREVERMLRQQGKPIDEKEGGAPVRVSKPKFDSGDHVRVNDGTFAGMEGEVMQLHEDKGQVTVQVTIFGRPVNVELEYWQVEKI